MFFRPEKKKSRVLINVLLSTSAEALLPCESLTTVVNRARPIGLGLGLGGVIIKAVVKNFHAGNGLPFLVSTSCFTVRRCR